jgi:hypothetical protein
MCKKLAPAGLAALLALVASVPFTFAQDAAALESAPAQSERKPQSGRLTKPAVVPIRYISEEAYAKLNPDLLRGNFVLPNLILAAPRINDQMPAHSFIDTAASATFVDDDYARRLGLETGPPVQGRGLAGKIEAKVAEVDSIKMGAAQVKDDLVGVIDMSTLSLSGSIAPQVVIGSDFLSQFVTQIDYQNQTITFHDRGDRPELEFREVVVPMNVEDGRPTVEAVLNGSIKLTMVVDTSMTKTSIPRKLAEALKPAKTFPGSVVMGVDGRLVRERGMLLDSLALGRLVVEKVPVSFPSGKGVSAEASASESGDVDLGLLGNDVLSLFQVTLDYSRGELRLRRVPFAEPSLFTMCGVGVDFEPTPTGLKVIEVVPGSSAEKQGLRIGDVVLSVNGLAVSQDNFRQALDQFYGPAGTKIKLSVKRGDQTLDVEVEKRMLL